MKLMAYKYIHTPTKTFKKPEIIPATWQKNKTASIKKEISVTLHVNEFIFLR